MDDVELVEIRVVVPASVRARLVSSCVNPANFSKWAGQVLLGEVPDIEVATGRGCTPS